MNRIGQIVKLTGKDSYAIVQMQRHSACGDCGACQMGDENQNVQVEVLNSAGGNVGDWVVVELSHQSVIQAAFIAYTIPLAVLVLSIVVGINVFGIYFSKDVAEVYAFIFGVLLTGVCYAVIRRFDQRFKREGKFQSMITRIIDQDNCQKDMKEDGQ